MELDSLRKEFLQLEKNHSDFRIKELFRAVKEGEGDFDDYSEDDLILMNALVHKEFNYSHPELSKEKLVEMNNKIIDRLGDSFEKCRLPVLKKF